MYNKIPVKNYIKMMEPNVKNFVAAALQKKDLHFFKKDIFLAFI
jgi:hypothetical protein